MRIQHNIMAMNAYRNYNNNIGTLSKNLEKLSSGYRINRAGDDAAGLAISEKMRADIAVYDQSIRNANDGISLVQTAEGAMTEIHSMLNRMVTLATQGANGTYSSTDQDQIELELAALGEEIARIEKDTKFNGQAIFGSASSGFSIRVSQNSTIDIDAVDTVGDVSGDAASFDTAAITAIKTHIDTVSSARATLGAIQNRLEHTVNNLGVTMENLQNAESTIRDTNVADEMMKYTKNNILIQSAQAMLAQANQVPQGVLQLMQ